jgi:hypothetical protein
MTERKRRIENPDKVIFSRGQTPLGRSWEAWVELWCKWYYRDRLTDKMCIKWNQDNEDQQVCFLRKTLIDTYEHNIEYETTVTKGRFVFFPLINNLISFYEYPNLKSENDLQMFAKSELDKKKIVFLSVNDHEIKNMDQYRIHSHLFDITLLENNDHESQTMKTQAIADGYWLFLNLLHSGRNKICFTVEISLSEDIHEENEHASRKDKFVIRVSYNVKVMDN